MIFAAMLLKVTLAAVILALTNYLYRLTSNYIAACRLCLPIVVCPFTWRNAVWALIATKLRLQRFSHLPGLRWLRYTHHEWPLHDTYHSRIRFGPAFILVSAGGNELMLHDPKAVTEVLGKYKKWERPRDTYKIFSLLGENVDSVSSEGWPRHRRVMNAGFVEANMHVVWETAEKQVAQWLEERTMNFHRLTEATDKISANVLMQVAFGKDYDFHDRVQNDVMEDQGTSFTRGINLIMSNLFFAWAVKNRRTPALLESRKMKELRESMVDVTACFKYMIRYPYGELIKAMVETNMNEKEAGRNYLSEDELCGNLFILQLAGSDTTSYAISFTIAMLSVHLDIQDWIREEIIPGSYDEAYPRTLRCRAAVMETLRFHTPVPSLPRHSLRPEILRIAGQDYVIPAGMLVSGSIPSVHNDPEIWGDDVGEWKPSRWIEVANGIETLIDRFEMIAWSTGPRVCPGKKFSLVEAAAVICTVLRDYRLKSTANTENMLRDFEYSTTPKPKNPESASIKFIKIQHSS